MFFKISYLKKDQLKFLENTLSLFSIRGIELILIIILTPFFIDKIGLEYYGKYVFVLSYAMIFVNFLGYGFDISAVRNLSINSQNFDKLKEEFNTVFSVKIVLFIIVFISYFLIVFLSSNLFSDYFFPSFGFLMIVSELFSFRWFLRGIQNMKALAVINFFSFLIYFILVFYFIKMPLDSYKIFVFHACGFTTLGIFSFIWIQKKYSIKFNFIGIVAVKKYLRQNVTSFANLLVPSILSSLTVFSAGLLLKPLIIGILEISIKYANIFSTPNTILTLALYPMVNKNKKLMKLSIPILLGSGVLFSIIMFLTSNFLLSIWLKEESTQNLELILFLVKILSITPFLMSIISAYGVNGLLVLKKDKLYAIISISVLIACFLLVLLVSLMSYKAVIFVLIIVRFLYGFFSFLFFNRFNSSKEYKII